MNDLGGAIAQRNSRTGIGDWILCGLLAVNFTLFVLSFFPAFSGIGPKPGLADRLWGAYRFAGWRADFVWMCFSTMLVFVGAARPTREPGPKHAVTLLCRLWLSCFAVYSAYMLMHMFG